ncbi:hypothetical protein [Natronococcus occultus]|uniref:Uncharacterized protein n=1 Tax=Natronococcus occultus SP4 TaxID=694430 RepID=L0JVM3_9EURY|nr:hypothetical protein [Natronococcus occultus]AGB37087.1 hypothetical protein Natoc_1259 [Natronococcus occultus SP4]
MRRTHEDVADAVAGYEPDPISANAALDRKHQLETLLESAGDIPTEVVDELERKRDRALEVLQYRTSGTDHKDRRNGLRLRGDGEPVGSPLAEVL